MRAARLAARSRYEAADFSAASFDINAAARRHGIFDIFARAGARANSICRAVRGEWDQTVNSVVPGLRSSDTSP